MERAGEHDDIGPTGHLLGQLHRGLGDLGARVGEEERVDRAGRELGEPIGERLEQVVGSTFTWAWMNRPAWRGDRGDDVRVAVAGAVDRDPGREVEVLVAVDGGDPAALTARDLAGR